MHTLTSPLDALEAATERVVALKRPARSTIVLGGSDVLRYLHAVCTQHTLDRAPGDATQALLLPPKGKVEFAFRLAVLEGGVLGASGTARARGAAVASPLWRFRHGFTVGQPVPGAAPMIGPGADAALAAA